MTITHTELVRTLDGTELPAPGTFVLDPAHSGVGFVARHLVVAKVRGRFSVFEGTFTVAEDPTDSSVEVSIDAASIDTREEQRDAHLRSPDFLDADNHPSLRYQSTKVVPQGPGRWQVEGELTIRDVTRPVTLDATLEGVVPDPWGNQRMVLAARGEIDREDWGLRWNQALETGGVLVGRKVAIEIEAEAVRQG